MVINYFSRFLITVFIASLMGCSYGNYISNDYTKLSDLPCNDRPNNVFLFFEGENIDFQYQKMAIIEVDGEKYSDNTAILNQLKCSAWSNCADGIINVKKTYKNREMGVIGNDKSKEVYTSSVFTGIAVKIKQDSSFTKKYGCSVDTSFLTPIRAYYENKAEDSKFKFVGGLIGTWGLMVYLAAKMK